MGTVQYNWKLPRSCQLLCGITVAPLLRERVFAHAMTSLMLDYYKTMLAPVLCLIFPPRMAFGAIPASKPSGVSPSSGRCRSSVRTHPLWQTQQHHSVCSGTTATGAPPALRAWHYMPRVLTVWLCGVAERCLDAIQLHIGTSHSDRGQISHACCFLHCCSCSMPPCFQTSHTLT